MDLIRVLQVAVIRRLFDRFKLDPTGASDTFLLPIIIPVTMVDDLLADVHIVQDILDISGVAGTFVSARTVPNGKRWKLKRVWVENTTGGTSFRAGQIGSVARQLSPAIQAAAWTENLDIRLNEGDAYGLAGTGNGADTTRAINMVYEEEDAR